MRHALALGSLIALTVCAEAATAHHAHKRHHLAMRPGVASSFAAVPGWADVPRPPPAHYNDTPRYDDPSKFGGEAALPVR
jgi:hypothetical protein